LAVEFWNATADGPQEVHGLFERLRLVDQAILHHDFAVCRYEPAVDSWLSVGTGRLFRELVIRANVKDTAATRRQEMIQRAAYFNAEHRGFSCGREQDDWLRAEAQIDAQLWFCRGMIGASSPMSRVYKS
jgi:hypothetical protein